MNSFSSCTGLRKTFLLLALMAIVSGAVPSSYAQEELHPAPSETIHLKVGDIFEILPIHDIPDATYTWILTQDRTFLEANRAPSFRKRLIQPGMYTLYAEIASADGTKRITRTISLDYDSRQPGEPLNGATTPDNNILVRTEPAADDKGRVVLPAGTQLVELLPVNPDVVPLALDLDLAKDADNDGKPDNDIQADDTFFHSDATPLFLWITNDPLNSHSISITAAAPEGARTQKLDILSKDTAQTQGVIKSPVRIETAQTAERTYTFTAVFENPDAAAGQLLYQWQFGDGQESLVTKPEHTYAEDKTYAVSLLIRNLRDGSEVASTSMGLNVAPAAPSSSGSDESSESSEPTTNPSSGSGVGITSVLMLVGLFLLSLAIGVGVIFLIGKLRGSKTSLADRIESMEKSVVKSPVDQMPNLTIAPPSVVTEKKIQEPPAAIAEREKEVAVEAPAPQPTVKPEATPSWLTTPTAKSTPTPAPVPAPMAPVVPPTPKPAAPAPVQPPKPAVTEAPVKAPTPATSGQTPSWLQTPAAAPAASVTPKPVTPPTPVASQAPKPVETPVVAPITPKPSTPQPAIPAAATTAATPAWLQTPTLQTPKPAPAPTPVAQQAPVVQPLVQKPVEAPPPPSIPANSIASVLPTAPQPPKPVAPVVPMPTTPVVPQASKLVPPTAPVQASQPQTPKPQPPVMPPKPVTPVVAPVATPQPQTPKPVEAPVAPAVPPQAPKPIPAAIPAAPVQPTVTPEVKPAPTQMDIPRASDDQIAIIRAESLNQQDTQNG